MQRSYRISLAALICCLCLGSLVAMPMINAFSTSALEISEIDAENNGPSSQTEFGEEFLFETIVGAIIAYLFFSKSKSMSPDFRTAYLSPHFPPPKYS
jgi:hypothetical protein